MKKAFWVGFLVGVLYFFIGYVIMVSSGCPLDFDLGDRDCARPIAWANAPTFYVLTFLAFFARPLVDVVPWSILLPIINGFTLGLLFMLIKKVFHRNSNNLPLYK